MSTRRKAAVFRGYPQRSSAITLPNAVITGDQALLTREALTKSAEITLSKVRNYEVVKPKAENRPAADDGLTDRANLPLWCKSKPLGRFLTY
jgi:hypothetical protein